MIGPAVQWRTVSHQLSDDDELLRFRVVDMNAVINKAVGDADPYRDALRHLRRDPTPWLADAAASPAGAGRAGSGVTPPIATGRGWVRAAWPGGVEPGPSQVRSAVPTCGMVTTHVTV